MSERGFYCTKLRMHYKFIMTTMTIPIEQALYSSSQQDGCRMLARSPNFLDEWLSEIEQLCTSFGERPDGVACSACVFAQPCGNRHVAVVQVADGSANNLGWSSVLGFRVLILAREAYAGLGGDPFSLADRFPPTWQARGELPTLSCPAEAPPPRTVEQICEVLQRSAHHSQTLLGGAQALVDGGRLVFERSEPDDQVLRDLWLLLPTHLCSELWPASYAFNNALPFDVLVVPPAVIDTFPDYIHESVAGDYPEGRYELNLQIAAETGNQRELNALFARRSRRETWRLAVTLLVTVLALSVIIPWLKPEPAPVASSAASATLELPGPDAYPALSVQERQNLTVALQGLAKQVNASAASNATAEELLVAIDQRLGTPDPQRHSGPLKEQGPPQRQLRVLLWKHGISVYNNPQLKPTELIKNFEKKLSQNKMPGK